MSVNEPFPTSQGGHPTRNRSEGDRRLKVGLLVIVTFLYWAALYLYAPTLPLYAQSKASNLNLIGLALATYGLGHVVIRLPLGVAVAQWGKHRSLIVVGLVLVGLGALIMAMARSISQLAVGRAVTGVAAGTWVPLVLIFCSLFPLEEGIRAAAILTLIGSVARALASSATGFLNDIGGLPLAFFIAAGLAGLAILLVLPVREEPKQATRSSPRQLRSVITRREVLFPSLLGAISQHADWAVPFGFLPILASQAGATNVGQSELLGMYMLMVIVGNLATAALSKLVPIRLLMLLGFMVLTVGIGSAAIGLSLRVLFLAEAAMGLAQGLCQPMLLGLVIQYVSDAERAMANGFYQSAYALGMLTGPWVGGLLAGAFRIRPMFGLTAVGTLLVSLPLIYRLGPMIKLSSNPKLG